MRRQNVKSNHSAWIIVLSGLVIITVLIAVMSFTDGSSQTSSVWRIDGPSQGRKSAKIRIVEFGDFQCPTCKEFHPILDKLLEEKPDLVQIQYRHFIIPEHQNAHEAALASEIAHSQGKFWPLHKMLLANQNEWSNAGDARQIFYNFNILVGIEESYINSAYTNSGIYASRIQEDMQIAVENGVVGTPTLFFNDRKYDGPLTYEGIVEAVRQLQQDM